MASMIKEILYHFYIGQEVYKCFATFITAEKEQTIVFLFLKFPKNLSRVFGYFAGRAGANCSLRGAGHDLWGVKCLV